MNFLFDWLLKSAWGRAFYIFVVSMLPVLELRGGIILAASPLIDMPWLEAYIICVIGNMIPVPFIILFIRKFLEWLKNNAKIGAYVERFENKIAKKADIVTKYEIFGLLFFVAVPFPGTGAWTGAAIAAFLNMKLKRAVPTILLGVMIAGVIMCAASYGFVAFLSFLA